jgi:hypothetical protein
MVENFDLVSEIVRYDLAVADRLPDLHIQQGLVIDQLRLELGFDMLKEHDLFSRGAGVVKFTVVFELAQVF